jgi:hypothetical protein
MTLNISCPNKVDLIECRQDNKSLCMSTFMHGGIEISALYAASSKVANTMYTLTAGNHRIPYVSTRTP